MNDPEQTAAVEALVEALAEGRLDAADRLRLARLMESDPQTAASVRGQLAMSRMLQVWHAGADPGFAARIETLARSNRHSQRVASAHAISRRIRERGLSMRRRQRGWLAPAVWAAAAAILIVSVLTFAMPGSNPYAADVTAGGATLAAGRSVGPGGRLGPAASFTVANSLDIRLIDRTTLRFAPGRYALSSADSGVTVELVDGTVRAEVAAQPVGRTLRFATPHAEAVVLGTSLDLTVDRSGTHLAVSHGRVRLRGRSSGEIVVVAGGAASVGLDGQLRPDPPSAIAALPARPAEGLVDLIGVGTWLAMPGSVEDRRFDDLMLPRLAELGVRHLRDIARLPGGVGEHAAQRERWRLLAAAGIDAMWVVQDPDPQTGTLAQLADLGGGCVRIVSGPDEPDRLRPDLDHAALRRGLVQLHAAVQAGAPGVQVCGTVFADSRRIGQVGDCADVVDFAGMKHMLASRHPETTGWGDGGYGSLPWALAQAGRQAPGRPIILARAGYHAALTGNDGHLGTPEDVIALYLPRLVLAYADAGVHRAYLADLIDREESGIAGAWGLLRSDGTPKPAFHALRGFINVFSGSDAGADVAAVVDPLMSVSAESSLRRQLFRRRDGTSLLAMWLPEPVYDPTSGVRLMPGTRRATVGFDPRIATITAHVFDGEGIVRSADLQARPTGSGRREVVVDVGAGLVVLSTGRR